MRRKGTGAGAHEPITDGVYHIRDAFLYSSIDEIDGYALLWPTDSLADSLVNGRLVRHGAVFRQVVDSNVLRMVSKPGPRRGG